jgi:hypothetical protein
MTEPEFHDWSGFVRQSIAILQRVDPAFMRQVTHVMEIGCFHGCTTNFLCDYFRSASPHFQKVVCIDPWDDHFVEYGNEASSHIWVGQYDKFQRNTERNKAHIHAIRGKSQEILPVLSVTPPIDFAYVDGDHTRIGVYQDLVGLLPHMKQGGYILIDDYLWGDCTKDPDITPKLGVDQFLEENKDRVQVVFAQYQLLARVL